MFLARCLDEDKWMLFKADTAYDAMKKLIYTLNVMAGEDKGGKIVQFKTNNYLFCVHREKCWVIKI